MHATIDEREGGGRRIVWTRYEKLCVDEAGGFSSSDRWDCHRCSRTHCSRTHLYVMEDDIPWKWLSFNIFFAIFIEFLLFLFSTKLILRIFNSCILLWIFVNIGYYHNEKKCATSYTYVCFSKLKMYSILSLISLCGKARYYERYRIVEIIHLLKFYNFCNRCNLWSHLLQRESKHR